MIQDIAPKKFSNVFAIKTPKAEDLMFLFRKGKVLLYHNGGEMEIPTSATVEQYFPKSLSRARYLCSADETDGFLISDVHQVEEENGCAIDEMEEFSFEDVRIFRSMTPGWKAFMGVTANHLNQWYSRNQFCGRCGGKMTHSTTERCMICPDCGFMDYPKICPVVIVGIKHGNRLLLTKYANRNAARYALVAGFCEIGETVEETVHREVMEEVGVKVKNLTYYKSQPWGFSESLLFGFFAELDGAEDITLDYNELAVGQWIEREDIPEDPENSLSLTYTMMQAFKNGEIQ